MEVYYHKTDGGAEYLSTNYVECPNGHREGTTPFFARIDSGVIQLFPAMVRELGFDRIVVGNVIINCE